MSLAVVGDFVNGPASATDGAFAAFDGTSGKLIKAATLPAAREVLSADRTYYVRTDGSDSNTGLVDSSGGAFLTIQKAIDVVGALDISIYTVTIQVRSGTYTGGVLISGPWVGTGVVHLLGDTTTPTNCVISTTSANAITVTGGGRLRLGGFKIQTTTTGYGVQALNNANITITGAMNYGAIAHYQIDAQYGGIIVISANYTISGGGLYHWSATATGLISAVVITITLSGTPAFSQQFARSSRAGVLEVHLNTFSGSATGTRYLADTNGVIFTNGAGATYLPGNAGGSVASGGQYA